MASARVADPDLHWIHDFVDQDLKSGSRIRIQRQEKIQFYVNFDF
jgi:hypothetical protein